MWQIGLVVSLILLIPLLAYAIKSEAILHLLNAVGNRLNKKVDLEEKFNKFLLENHPMFYVFAAIFIFGVIYIVLLGFIQNITTNLYSEAMLSRISMSVIAALMIVYMVLVFEKYVNKKMWQLSKTNKHLLSFTINGLVGWSPRLSIIGGFSYMCFAILGIFFIPPSTSAITLEPYQQFTSNLLYTFFYFGISFFIVGIMLRLEVSDPEALSEILKYYRTPAKDKKGRNQRFMLSKAVDYCQKIISEDFQFISKFEVGKQFELLVITEIWGNKSEKEIALKEIDSLIMELDEGNYREFFETLSNLSNDSKLGNIQKLKSSLGLSLFETKELIGIGTVGKIVALIAASLTIINLLKPYLVELLLG